jgi:hypothetical protein
LQLADKLNFETNADEEISCTNGQNTYRILPAPFDILPAKIDAGPAIRKGKFRHQV